MAIESVKNVENVESEPNYPCLMEADSGVVWLMTSRHQGTLVHPQRCSVDSIGYVSENLNCDLLKPFNGNITLS